jgi:hypothetical protein
MPVAGVAGASAPSWNSPPLRRCISVRFAPPLSLIRARRCTAGILILLLQALLVSAQLRSVYVYYSPYGSPCDPNDAYLHFYECEVNGRQHIARSERIDAPALGCWLVVLGWAGASAPASTSAAAQSSSMEQPAAAASATANHAPPPPSPQVWVNGVNVALGRSTYQTSIRAGLVSEYAVDGNRLTNMHTELPSSTGCE